MLSIGTEYRNGILFVRLRGILNKDTVYKLNKRVTNMVKENGISNIVFNFTNLKSIDLKGINTIFYNYELSKKNNGTSFICGNNDNIKKRIRKSRLINYVYEIPSELAANILINTR